MWNFVNKSKYKMCISIVQKANENSIEFSLSTQTRRVIKSSQTKSLHRVGFCQGPISIEESLFLLQDR